MVWMCLECVNQGLNEIQHSQEQGSVGSLVLSVAMLGDGGLLRVGG